MLFCRKCQAEQPFSEDTKRNLLRAACGHTMHPFQPFIELSYQHDRDGKPGWLEELSPRWDRLTADEHEQRFRRVARRVARLTRKPRV
jgi:hypothetical protein